MILTRRGPALPDFPWDSLADHAAKARKHPGGVVDLSVGTPVDPVPAVIQAALQSVADIPGYPTTHGTPELRAAFVAAVADEAARDAVAAIDTALVLRGLRQTWTARGFA